MASYSGDNPHELLSIIHGDTDIANFTDNRLLIKSVCDVNVPHELEFVKNHLGREYFRRLSQMGKSADITDAHDAGFRPLTVAGLFA
tara:strand:+ start:397 stop:657 length:261 start_codon:yes stop_codon:yes gene_type:complete